MDRTRFALAFAFLALPLVIEIGSTAPDKQSASIKGRLGGKVRATPISPRLYELENEAVGTISRFGRVSARWVVHDVEFDAKRGQIVVGRIASNGIITAANGDQIFGEYRFRNPVITLGADGSLSAEADLRITGGTGRFANATGHAASLIRANVFTSKSTITIEGQAANGH